MVSCGDHGELKHVHCDKCDELVWCSRVVPGVPESTGCTVGQARQLVDRCACECYERQGMMYLLQSCRAGSMRDAMNGICLTYGVGSRVTGVMAACHGIQ